MPQNGGVQGVGFLFVREIYHFKVHGIDAGALLVLAQFKLGFVGARYLNIGLGGHGGCGIGQACALAADKVEGAMLLVYDGGGCTHEQAVDRIGKRFFCYAQFFQVLPDQGCRRRHSRCGHGCAG